MSRVAIVDAGLGNVGSVYNMVKRSHQVEVLKEPIPPTEGELPDALVLPGVGAFDEGVSGLIRSGWNDFLMEWTHAERMLLGLCLGMQLLCESSQEGSTPGLGLIPGTFVRLEQEPAEGGRIKVPHMGWNTVHFQSKDTLWAPHSMSGRRYYFAHSYRYSHPSDDFVVGRVRYGIEFAAAIQKGRTIGLQFHPEKSHRFGRDLLQRILAAA